MKILIINAADIKGGAAKVGYYLAKGLHERGHEVVYLVGQQYATDAFIQKIPARPASPFLSISNHIIHRLGVNQLGLISHFPFSLGKSFFQQFDLIHLHDLPNFNMAGLPWLTRLRPTVWTLHTLAPFTGNCLYPYSCERWAQNCGQCPQFGQFPLTWLHRDGSGLNLHTKRWIYRYSRLHLIGVSEWVSHQASQSILGRFPITTILNAVDTKLYRPLGSKTDLRRKFGIPEDANVILFSISGKLEDTRKGIDIILDALPKLKTSSIYLIPLGIAAANSTITDKLSGFAHRPFEHVEESQKLNELLNVSDLVWHPSRADTSSLMLLEAFSAQKTAVAAAVGGVREIVQDCDNGYLIPADSPQHLAEKTDLFFSLSQEQRQKMELQAWQDSQRRFNLQRFLDDHESAYKKVLETH